MAKTGINRALTGLSGTIDGWTYRSTPEGTLSVYVKKTSSQPPTARQADARERFRRAQVYAGSIMRDPLRSAVYQRMARGTNQRANNLLVSNYLNPPTIETVEIAGFTGAAGQEIRVLAFDPVEVVAVRLVFRDDAGGVLESGAAASDHGVWGYRTTTMLPAGVAWRLDVTATNRAGCQATVSLPRPASPPASPA